MDVKISKGMTCVMCKATAMPVKLRFEGNNIDGWKCVKCGEEYLHPGQAEHILTLNKLRRESLSAKLGRIKSNLILRIPKAIEQALNLKEGETITLQVKGAKQIELTTTQA